MKKITKITALALALALVLGMTSFATGTKVYFLDDLSSYATIDEYTAGTVRAGLPQADRSLDSAVARSLLLGDTGKYAFWTTNYGRFDSTGGAYFSTNSFGNKEVVSYSKTYQKQRDGSGTFVLVPRTAWSLNGNPDETYVISYEMGFNPSYDPTDGSDYNTAMVLWGGDVTLIEEPEEGQLPYSWSKGVQKMQMVWLNGLNSVAQPETVTTEVAGEEEEVGSSTSTTISDTTGVATKVVTEITADVDAETGEPTGTKTKTITTTVYNPAENFHFIGAGQGWNDTNNKSTSKLSTAVDHRVAFGLRADETNVAEEGDEYFWPTRIVVVDGKLIYSVSTNPSTSKTTYDFENQDKIVGFSVPTNVNHGNSYANFKIYTIKNDSFAAVADVDGDISALTKTVRVNFTNPVAASTFTKDVVVKKNGEVMTSGYNVGDLKDNDYTVGSEIYSYVDVEFDKLDGDSTYTIEFADTIANELATTLGEKNVATFTTTTAPTFTMTLAAYKGLSASGTAVSALSAGTTYFTVSAVFEKGEVVTNGNVRIDILDAEGNVVKFAKVDRDLTGIASLNAAFKLEAGQTAKAYVENADGVATIAAAQ